MSLQGSLKDIQLPDIVQLVSTAGKTGMFLLRRGTTEGRIYLQEGQIVHAEVGDLQGEDAVYEMAIWNEGEFLFQPEVRPPRVTVQRSNTTLFMEAARRIDEWRILSRKIPSMDMIPEIVPSLPQGRSHVQLNTGEWMVLARIDGQKTIRELAQVCGLSLFDTSKILYGLITHNLVSLKEPASGPPPSPPPAVEDTGAIRSEVSSDMQASGVTPATRHERLLTYLDRVRHVSLEVLGPDCAPIVETYYLKARAAVQDGQGLQAVQEAIVQMVREVVKLKGRDVVRTLLDQIKRIKV
ncbi:hypothetical protein HRbin11_02280 [bacterium HR11]|nr:hypothetical protein HRbin11_02280 [bacterium HR11]